jgi:hypothetical protein
MPSRASPPVPSKPFATVDEPSRLSFASRRVTVIVAGRPCDEAT